MFGVYNIYVYINIKFITNASDFAVTSNLPPHLMNKFKKAHDDLEATARLNHKHLYQNLKVFYGKNNLSPKELK